MPPFQSPEALDRALSLAATSRSATEQRAASLAAKGGALAEIHREYGWLPISLKIAMADSGLPKETVRKVAERNAQQRSKPGKKKKRQWWSGPLDVVKGVGSGVADVADFVTPERVEDAVGVVKDHTIDRVVNDPLLKGGVRYGLGVAQAGAEYADFAVRNTVKNVREDGWIETLLRDGREAASLEPQGLALDETTLGQHIQGKGMGSGFFPSGEAQKSQARQARSYGTINGKGITLGRLAASTIVQPGTKPYNLLSGLVDGAMEVVDPASIGLDKAARAAKGSRALTNMVSEGAVVRAAKSVDPAWRQEVEAVAGLVSGGHRRTVVPAAVDKWLFSTEAQKVTEELAGLTSPSAIYRKLGKKADAETVKALAAAPDARAVLDVLRPALGLGLPAKAVRGFGVTVVPSAQRQVRAFNLMPETFLPIDDPDTLIRNLDNSLANANVMGADRDAIVDLAFEKVVGANDPRQGLFDLAEVAAKSIEKSMVAHGTDPELAKELTRWTGSYVKLARYLADESGTPVNLPFLVDEAGDPVMGWKPSALYQLLNRGIPLYQPQDIREIRQLSSALNRVGVHSKAVQYPVAAVDFMQNGVWKLSAMVRAAYFLRVNGEEVVRSNGAGIFDNPVDYLAYAFGRRGLGDAKGDPFDVLKEVDEIESRLATLGDGADDGVRLVRFSPDETVTTAGRPQGVYLSYEDRGTLAKMPGDREHRVVGRPKNTLDVEEVEWTAADGTPVSATAGGAAVARLAGLDELRRFADLTPTEMRSELTRRFPDLELRDSDDDWLAHIETYGAALARKAGFDSIALNVEDVPSFSEFVALSDDVFAGSDAAALRARLGEIQDDLQNDMVKFYSALARGNPGNVAQADAAMGFRSTGVRQPADRRVDPQAWKRGAADLIVSQSNDPILRRVANGGLFNGDGVANPLPGMEGVREWLIAGTGRKFRRRLEAAFPEYDWTDPSIVDQYLDIQQKHIRKATGDLPDLRQAIATGRIGGHAIAKKGRRPGRMQPGEALKTRMDNYLSDPAAPNVIDVEVIERIGKDDPFGGILAAREALGRVFFGELYGATSDKLARSPVYRRSYWKWMEDHWGWLDADARTTALVNAEKHGLSKRELSRLKSRNTTPVGDLNLDDADAFAKGVALDEANNLLFDSSQRSQFFDIARVVFPFGEAWKEVSTNWARLLTTRPSNVRRAHQVITGARGADMDDNGVGFFHADPVTGEEMFSFVIDGPIMDWLGVENVGFEGSVAGLSFGTQLQPGLGPVGQWTAAALLPDIPETDFVARLLFPFGEPETDAAGLTTTLVPPYAKKWFEAFSANERKDQMFANAKAEMWRILASSGDYGNTEDELLRLDRDAAAKAQVVTGMRGLFQFFAPSAPQPRFFAETEKGDKVSGLLFRAYAELQEKENNGDIDSATEAFLDEYGDQAFVYLIGKSKSTVGGQGASREYGDWERKNSGFITKYKSIAGYFGPANEGYDPTVYNRQTRAGRRERRDTQESMRDAQQLVAGWAWRKVRDAAGAKPTKKQKAWLADAKKAIKAEYPMWNPKSFDPGQLAGRIETLGKAANDPAVADTPLAEAVRTYMDARSQAQQAAIQRGYGTSEESFALTKKAAPLRTWLRQVAESISSEIPEFRRVWDSILDAELDDDTEDQ